MDNEYVVKIGEGENEIEFHFRLKSQKIIGLEKAYGKNIFEIVQDLSFASITDFIGASLISPVMDKFELMDKLLENFSLQEISETIMTNIAVKSGLIKQKDIDDAVAEQSKN